MIDQATPRPWDNPPSKHSKSASGWPSPKHWTYVQHNFPDAPYEGDLDNEYGIYPPLGEAGPVALVAGEDNADLIVRAVNAHDDLLAVCDELLAYTSAHTHTSTMEYIVDLARIARAKANKEPS